MKIYTVLFLLTAFVFSACSSTEPAPNAANSANPAQPQSAAPEAVQPSAASPIETMRALNEAARNKNAAAIKSMISSGTLKLLETEAKEQKKTVDELLQQDDGAPFEDLPAMRNEKIEGERATIEIQNKVTEQWDTLPFIKENGVWKVAIDQYLEQVRQKMLEQMNEPPAETEESEKPSENKSEPSAETGKPEKSASNK